MLGLQQVLQHGRGSLQVLGLFKGLCFKKSFRLYNYVKGVGLSVRGSPRGDRGCKVAKKGSVLFVLLHLFESWLYIECCQNVLSGPHLSSVLLTFVPLGHGHFVVIRNSSEVQTTGDSTLERVEKQALHGDSSPARGKWAVIGTVGSLPELSLVQSWLCLGVFSCQLET